MLSKITTGALSGLEARLVTVETDDHSGLPAVNMVGLASKTVREAGERIRSALINTGYTFPYRRITINLSPAATRKEGSHFDLPIAIGVLSSTGQLNPKKASQYAFIGELSLDGNINRIKGALPLIMGFKENGVRRVILPKENWQEAAIVKGIDLFPFDNLSQVITHLQSGQTYMPPIAASMETKPSGLIQQTTCEDFADVWGQEHMKRIMVICAAGFHGLLLIGSPGTGKSMMARRLPTIMPHMNDREVLESTQVYSVAGQLSEKMPVVSQRPFRAPHHTISPRALVGGGLHPGPGEISLAHGGILFLDEFLEFRRSSLELLRQPIEDGYVTIARQGESIRFPSRCILVAACNPCPCGYRGDPKRVCQCSELQVRRYMGKLSGPLLDRFDMQATVYATEPHHFTGKGKTKQEGRPPGTSAQMRRDVERAAVIQRKRYKKEDIFCNGELTPQLLSKYCPLDKDGEALLETAMEKMMLSARGFHKVLKVARTVADLCQSEDITVSHLAEVLQYRQTVGGVFG